MAKSSQEDQSSQLARPPDSCKILSEKAENALRDAGVFGEVPADLDAVLEAAEIETVPDDEESRGGFFSSLPDQIRGKAKRMMQKLRGVADLRERKIWVPDDGVPQGVSFPKAHETSHQIIPWHSVGALDTKETLSKEVKEKFEREANFTASELIFQGDRFRDRALDYEASLDSAMVLADDHGASYQSTFWRYAEVQDQPIAILMYYPAPKNGNGRIHYFTLWRVACSESFQEKIGRDISLPSRIQPSHPWAGALDHDGICRGSDKMRCDGSSAAFEWQSWWNTYTLFVFLRRAPRFGFVGSVLQSAGD